MEQGLQEVLQVDSEGQAEGSSYMPPSSDRPDWLAFEGFSINRLWPLTTCRPPSRALHPPGFGVDDRSPIFGLYDRWAT